MGVYTLKLGDALPPRQAKPCSCPNCGDKVFEQYPNGFVNEIDLVSYKTVKGFMVAENWHCPGCGFSKKEKHEVDTHGLRINTNSSYSSKKRKNGRK